MKIAITLILTALLGASSLFGVSADDLKRYSDFAKSDASRWTQQSFDTIIADIDNKLRGVSRPGTINNYRRQIVKKWADATTRRVAATPAVTPTPAIQTRPAIAPGAPVPPPLPTATVPPYTAAPIEGTVPTPTVTPGTPPKSINTTPPGSALQISTAGSIGKQALSGHIAETEKLLNDKEKTSIQPTLTLVKTIAAQEYTPTDKLKKAIDALNETLKKSSSPMVTRQLTKIAADLSAVAQPTVSQATISVLLPQELTGTKPISVAGPSASEAGAHAAALETLPAGNFTQILIDNLMKKSGLTEQDQFILLGALETKQKKTQLSREEENKLQALKKIIYGPIIQTAIVDINQVLKQLEENFSANVYEQLNDISKSIEPLKGQPIHTLFSAINNCIRSLMIGKKENYRAALKVLKDADKKLVDPLTNIITRLEKLDKIMTPEAMKQANAPAFITTPATTASTSRPAEWKNPNTGSSGAGWKEAPEAEWKEKSEAEWTRESEARLRKAQVATQAEEAAKAKERENQAAIARQKALMKAEELD